MARPPFVPPPNPDYFSKYPHTKWSPSHYIRLSTHRERAAENGLLYIDFQEARWRRDRDHGINAFKWHKALQDLAENGTEEEKAKAADLLEDSTSRPVFRRWFEEQTKPRKRARGATAATPPANVTVNNTLTVVNDKASHGTTVDPATISDEVSEMDSLPHSQSSNQTNNTQSDSSTSYDSDDVQTTNLNFAQRNFLKTHRRIPANKKWVLTSSGRVVEDVIRDWCLRFKDDLGTPLASYVLDLDSALFGRIFEAGERREIMDSFPDMHTPCENLLNSFRRFSNVKSLSDLQTAIDKTHYLPPGVEYSDEYFYARWADFALRGLLLIYNSPNRPIESGHLEGWYSMVWVPLIDYCLVSIPGTTLERAEVHSKATAARRNRGRNLTGPGNRQRSGRHHDGILSSSAEPVIEYMVLEVGKSFGGPNTTKVLNDTFKIIVALRDMLTMMHSGVKYNIDITPNLQVIGIGNFGPSIEVTRMVNSRGNTCLLKREPRICLPSDITCNENMKSILHMVVLMQKIRESIIYSMSLLDRGEAISDGDEKAESFIGGLRKGMEIVRENGLTDAADSDRGF